MPSTAVSVAVVGSEAWEQRPGRCSSAPETRSATRCGAGCPAGRFDEEQGGEPVSEEYERIFGHVPWLVVVQQDANHRSCNDRVQERAVFVTLLNDTDDVGEHEARRRVVECSLQAFVGAWCLQDGLDGYVSPAGAVRGGEGTVLDQKFRKVRGAAATAAF